jgi:hypothetical protein
MVVIVVIVIITVVLLISMDRVSGRQTTNGRSLKAADDRFLNRFLHRRSQRRNATEALTTRLEMHKCPSVLVCLYPFAKTGVPGGRKLFDQQGAVSTSEQVADISEVRRNQFDFRHQG